jgi:hypothetical protein
VQRSPLSVWAREYRVHPVGELSAKRDFGESGHKLWFAGGGIALAEMPARGPPKTGRRPGGGSGRASSRATLSPGAPPRTRRYRPRAPPDLPVYPARRDYPSGSDPRVLSGRRHATSFDGRDVIRSAPVLFGNRGGAGRGSSVFDRRWLIVDRGRTVGWRGASDDLPCPRACPKPKALGPRSSIKTFDVAEVFGVRVRRRHSRGAPPITVPEERCARCSPSAGRQLRELARPHRVLASS